MECFFAKNMLNTAGVFQRSFLADSNGHQITGDNLVTLVNASGDGQAQAEAAAGAAGRVGPVKALEEACKLCLG